MMCCNICKSPEISIDIIGMQNQTQKRICLDLMMNKVQKEPRVIKRVFDPPEIRDYILSVIQITIDSAVVVCLERERFKLKPLSASDHVVLVNFREVRLKPKNEKQC